MNSRAVDEPGGRAVHSLGAGGSVEDLDSETWYLATVNGVVPYGIFVDVTEELSGLVHESNFTQEYDVGDEVVVELISVQENGDIAFDVVDITDYKVVTQHPSAPVHSIPELEETADTITIEGRIDQIKQTGGPTIYTINDGEGIIECAAFVEAGVRAYPAVELGDIVRMVGTVTQQHGTRQFEIDDLDTYVGDDASSRRDTIEDRLAERAKPPAVEPLIEWPALTTMWSELESLATQLRGMILDNRPIRIRHHADGDGMCAAVPVALALSRYAQRTHADENAGTYLVQRSPSKAPFYELEDAVRDLNFALRDRERHGQRLPMVLMLDNGSTSEDVPAYRNLAHYDIPVGVVDHHHPDAEAVEDLLTAHINPYLHGEDYRVTTGMLCVELARLIDPALTDRIAHVPAVAGLTDRSEANAMEDYLARAADAGYDLTDIQEIGDALDYAAHWLRYRSGSRIISDVLGVTPDTQSDDDVRAMLAERAKSAIARQREDALPHVTERTLDNGATLYQLDLDAHAHRFEYPAPGSTTGAIHDHMATDGEDPVITIGYGPDFAVLRSDGVRLDIPEMVTELREELPGAGITGGGHLVVGSVKFVKGRRETVISALIEKMSAASIDQDLSSTIAMPDTDE